MKANEGMSVDAQVQFLFSKWKHHDDLMYRRLNFFWQVQTIMFVITGFYFSVFEFSLSESAWGLVFPGLLLYLFGSLSRDIRNGVRTDRICRNAFNVELTRLLWTHSDLLSRRPFSDDIFDIPHDPSDNNDVINKWHGPVQLGKKIVSTSGTERMMVFVSWFEIFLGLVLVMFAITAPFLQETAIYNLILN
ncbi:MAG: hypothetical protein AAGC95_17135 [Pseudomonadota bacterium]